MPVNTLSVATAVTPTVIHTYISHYFNRGPLRQKPTAHISYHEGLELIRRFLYFASFHTVDQLQAFTSQWVPVPVWVHVEEIEIPSDQLARSAAYLQAQLGPDGIDQVGGGTWWQWRRDNLPLKAEWIEMRKDSDERRKSGAPKGQRIMLYVHGGAYFFGSVDEHRYQMQRHARKLKARVIAPKYRLAPQFPFPCGLQDCLATYLYLLEQNFDPNTIILAGDSAGGGMVLSILVTLRDRGLPLPAGAILISPWVDLTHSFPSLGGDGKLDYIPPHGFIHKPNMSWPPPNADDLLEIERNAHRLEDNGKPRMSRSGFAKEDKIERVRGFSLTNTSGKDDAMDPGDEGANHFVSADGKYSIGPKTNPVLSVQLDQIRVQIKDQIQIYAPNHLITHPLVSPVLQPTLGGLPPLLIQTGGGELLHDEQVYLAHKAAQPLAYLPPPSNHLTAEDIEAEAARYRPTNVQLQIWDDLCHVAPTLSFTRPAKHMYRSIAQFGAWALARAQKTSIDILDDDDISFVSSCSSTSSSATESKRHPSSDEIKLSMPQSAQHVNFESIATKPDKGSKVGKAGDPLPPFENHMIRQRVDRNGKIYPLEPVEELVALNLPTVEIGVPKPGPVNKWMAAQKQWNGKFAKQKLKVQKRRRKELEVGYERFSGEKPPPTALAGRRVKGMKAEKAKKKSWGMALWSLWGSKHDEATIHREEKADNAQDEVTPTSAPEAADGPKEAKPNLRGRKSGSLAAQKETSLSRSHSRRATVTDEGQADVTMDYFSRLAPPISGLAEATRIAPERQASYVYSPSELSEAAALYTSTVFMTPRYPAEDSSRPQSPQTVIPTTDTHSTRPTRGGVAYPFRLKIDEGGREFNASTATLESLSVQNEEGLSKVVDTDGKKGAITTSTRDEQTERPAVERFVTADVGELITAGENTHNEMERPGVERFETAPEYTPQ